MTTEHDAAVAGVLALAEKFYGSVDKVRRRNARAALESAVRALVAPAAPFNIRQFHELWQLYAAASGKWSRVMGDVAPHDFEARADAATYAEAQFKAYLHGLVNVAPAQAAPSSDARSGVLAAALRRIERWFGEFPATGKFWDEEKTRPTSYAGEYGSNGERDYMRAIARTALASYETAGSAPSGDKSEAGS